MQIQIIIDNVAFSWQFPAQYKCHCGTTLTAITWKDLGPAIDQHLLLHSEVAKRREIYLEKQKKKEADQAAKEADRNLRIRSRLARRDVYNRSRKSRKHRLDKRNEENQANTIYIPKRLTWYNLPPIERLRRLLKIIEDRVQDLLWIPIRDDIEWWIDIEGCFSAMQQLSRLIGESYYERDRRQWTKQVLLERARNVAL